MTTGRPPATERCAQAPEAFHKVVRVLPKSGRVTVSPDVAVEDALKLMADLGVSHLQVLSGTILLGVFSFRSFALGAAGVPQHDRSRLVDLPVEEFLDPPKFVHASESVDDAIVALNGRGVLLVEEAGGLIAAATTTDFLRYLRGVTRPFLLLQEIELGVRALLSECLTPDEVRACAAAVLANAYSRDPSKLPAALLEMTFGDYVSIIGDGRAWRDWPKISHVFGGTRERASAKLKGVQTIRNDVFHFRRALLDEDFRQLTSCRDWLSRRATLANRVLPAAPHPSTDAPA